MSHNADALPPRARASEHDALIRKFDYVLKNGPPHVRTDLIVKLHEAEAAMRAQANMRANEKRQK